MTAGMAVGTIGLLALTRVGADSPYALLLAGYLPFGVALGLVYAPMSTAAMAAMPPEKVGIASGVLAMDRVMAGTVALAATGALSHALLEDGHSFAAAIAGSTWILVALCAAGTVLTWAFVRDVEPPRHDPRHRHSHL
jgi:MFS family permease